MDNISPERRSENMRRIRNKNTAPEVRVRKAIRQLGYSGYRLHRKDLPAKPDIAWVGKKIAIFVHGCFWHGHDCAEGLRKPKSNRDYWIPKLTKNSARDEARQTALTEAGWKILVLWECELKSDVSLERKLRKFLKDAFRMT